MKPIPSNYFTQSDKLKLYNALQKKTELGLVLALEMFDDMLGEMVQAKAKETGEIIAGILSGFDEQIKSRQLKDGTTPIAGKDYPTPEQIYAVVKEITDDIRANTKLEVTPDMFNAIASRVKVKHGTTPLAGADYPTWEQIKAYIDTSKTPVLQTTVVRETKSDDGMKDSIDKRFKQLELLIRNMSRNAGKRRGGGDSIVAGSNITVTRVGGRRSIASSAGGGSGFTELTATGTINSVNAAFTFTEKPDYIVKDGVFMKENKGWTWSSGTLTATLDVPPDVDIYGVT